VDAKRYEFEAKQILFWLDVNNAGSLGPVIKATAQAGLTADSDEDRDKFWASVRSLCGTLPNSPIRMHTWPLPLERAELAFYDASYFWLCEPWEIEEFDINYQCLCPSCDKPEEISKSEAIFLLDTILSKYPSAHLDAQMKSEIIQLRNSNCCQGSCPDFCKKCEQYCIEDDKEFTFEPEEMDDREELMHIPMVILEEVHYLHDYFRYPICKDCYYLLVSEAERILKVR